jgi:hypothetical protein
MSSRFHNIIEVLGSQMYYYSLWGYVKGHSLLALQIHEVTEEPDDATFVIFENVQYFEGYMRGLGKFIIGSDADCLHLLKRIKGFEIVDERHLLSSFELIQINKNSDIRTRIIAQNGYIVQASDVSSNPN